MRSRSAILSDRLFLVLTPLEKIYLDFLQTQFIESSAIGALVHNLKASKQKEIELILINVQPPVMAVLSLTGLDAVFQIQFSEIKIWDFGEPFDLATKVELLRHNQEFPLQRDKRWGWKLMDQITDELRYFRVKDRNCLLMRKSMVA